MMKNLLTEAIIETLKKNWGDKAEALECYAEVKFIDPLSSWACYVFAMDEREEMINVLITHEKCEAEILTVPFQELMEVHNIAGEHPVIDEEYRRRKVSELLRRYS